MSENAVGNGEAVAGTNPHDPSAGIKAIGKNGKKPYHELKELMIKKLKGSLGK